MSKLLPPCDPIAALDLAKQVANGTVNLARVCGCRPQSVSKWHRRGGIPPKRVPAISRATGLPRHWLRPDLPDMFPPPLSGAA